MAGTSLTILPACILPFPFFAGRCALALLPWTLLGGGVHLRHGNSASRLTLCSPAVGCGSCRPDVLLTVSFCIVLVRLFVGAAKLIEARIWRNSLKELRLRLARNCIKYAP